MWKVRALDMINGLNGGSVEPVLTSIHISLKKQTNRKKKVDGTVWKNGGHGDERPGCKPQRNGDLWT